MTGAAGISLFESVNLALEDCMCISCIQALPIACSFLLSHDEEHHVFWV